MNERDEAIERIKKLLRMKRGGTPEEIATALALAQGIASKHGIDLAGINPEEEDQVRPIHHEDALYGARLQFESRYAGMVCDQYFNVEVFSRRVGWKKISLTFVGTDWDRQIAIYVFRFLCGHFRREWKAKRGRCRNRQAFMWGLYVGLAAKLREAKQQPTEEGLVLVGRSVQRRNAYIEKHFGKLKEKDVRPDNKADESFHRGYVAGQATEIRKGVETKQPERMQIAIWEN